MTAFTVFIIILLMVIGPSLFVVIGKQREKAIPKSPSTALPLAEDATTLDRHWQSIRNGWNEKNALCLLHSNLDAFAVRVAAARAAGRSLDLMYYMWNADLTGRLMMREVIAAADRGVRVRLLLDDLGVSISDRIFHAIDSHPNIELRLFNPTRARENILHRSIELVLRFRSVNRRMHNKAWIADGRAVIVGGRNIGDAYFDAAERANFHDFDILGFGNIVADATEIFDDYWNSAVSVPVRSLLARRPSKLAKLRRELDALPKSEAAKPYLERVESQYGRDHFLMSDRLHWVEAADILADPPEKAAGKRRKGHNFLMESLLPLMQAASDSLHITSPISFPANRVWGYFNSSQKTACRSPSSPIRWPRQMWPPCTPVMPATENRFSPAGCACTSCARRRISRTSPCEARDRRACTPRPSPAMAGPAISVRSISIRVPPR